MKKKESIARLITSTMVIAVIMSIFGILCYNLYKDSMYVKKSKNSETSPILEAATNSITPAATEEKTEMKNQPFSECKDSFVDLELHNSSFRMPAYFRKLMQCLDYVILILGVFPEQNCYWIELVLLSPANIKAQFLKCL